jgi:transcriptional regulator with XRE-family HTH domain
MSEKWVRLGAAVRDAREAKGLTQGELGARVGVGNTTIANIERARVARATPTIRAVARELGWKPGSVEAILDGGDPVLADTQPAKPPEPPALPVNEGLPMRVARTLAEGTTLDTTIVSLGPNADMVVVIKGKPTATPEQLRAELEEWERREGHLRRLGLTADGPTSDESSATGGE